MFSDASSLFSMPQGIATRWATAENPKGEKGGACIGNDGRKRFSNKRAFLPGESYTMAEAVGLSGMVRRMWVTIDDRSPKMLRGIRLDMYWDGADTPAVSAPLGDFFCHGLGRMATFHNALFASPEGRSFNCCIPMPFKTGMKIVATNETDKKVDMFFYEVDYTIGDKQGPDTLCFHAHWRRENPTTLQKDYELLPKVTGRGRFLGVNIGCIANTERYFKSWWGEGEVKVFLDGDTDHPTLCGTGTEDYIGTGWGQGQYANLYQGCHLADHDKFQYCFYRLHVPDPVWFYKEARVTIQQIGCWNPSQIAQMHGMGMQLNWGERVINMPEAAQKKGWGLFERQDDWSACSYFYLDKPTNGLPPLAPLQERL